MDRNTLPTTSRERRRVADTTRGALNRWAVVFPALLLLTACGIAPKPDFAVLEPPEKPYEYPWINPYVATVVGTPPILRARLPKKISIDELTLEVIPDREIPELFWYNDALRFSLVHQQDKAPLIFVIAGTGAAHDAAKMDILQRAFFDAGFHVISLPSPTHPNFIVNASETNVPGRMSQDVRDLYRTMRLAYEQVDDRIDVSGIYLTGYSLGAMQAAFVARIDEQENAFDFDKVLMINPPVNLYNSSTILDHLLEPNLPGGIDGVGKFIDDVFQAIAETSYEQSQSVVFSDDLLYRTYLERRPSDDDLAALIGLSFRFSSNNMAFAADVMTNFGYVVPKGTTPDTTSSLTEYFQVGMRLTFKDYLDGFLYPYYQARDPGITRQHLITEASLASIHDYLAGADKIGLMTNEDDITLAKGEIDYLRDLFGTRATIFPTGGHCGNLDDRNVVFAMVNFFKQ